MEAAACARPATGYTYARRQPELGTLYRVVRENIRTLYAVAEAGFAGAALPEFVRQEVAGYLECGLLCRGFAALQCEDCGEHMAVGFGGKSRGFCPSCTGRRMAQTATNWLDHVLPATPLRQLVVTFPFELRQRLAYHGKALGAVGRIFMDSVLGWYRRRMRDEGIRDGRSGAVMVVQRNNADIKLSPHIHAILVDGVFATVPEGKPVFHALPRLSTDEVGDFCRSCAPACSPTLSAAAVSGLPPAGPELRRRPEPVMLRGHPGVEVTAPLSVTEFGFSLHAATPAGGEDARGREALCKYVLRPPLAHERLSLLPDGLVGIQLRKPFRDGDGRGVAAWGRGGGGRP
jgi:hypothetical protein